MRKEEKSEEREGGREGGGERGGEYEEKSVTRVEMIEEG